MNKLIAIPESTWSISRIRYKLNESLLLNSLDKYWLLPNERRLRRLVERFGREFLKFVSKRLGIPYTLVQRTKLDLESQEIETYLNYLDGRMVCGEIALKHGWLPFVAYDPVIESYKTDMKDINITIPAVRKPATLVAG